MNNQYNNIWTSPYCRDMVGFNGPLRPTWSPLPAPAPAPHMAPRGPHYFPMQQPYPNSFHQFPHPPMGKPPPSVRFTQYQFHPNQNDFHNKNQQSNANQSTHSLQYGSFHPNNYKIHPYQRDKKLGSQNRHFNGNIKNHNEKKKKTPKPNKRDLPENSAFYCDVCDRGFKTEEKLKEHIDGHEKCNEEGCTYVAAPKLVQLHIRNHHYTGLAKKIWSIESQEDIAKWIAERKKNFPTAANIEKKKNLDAEKKSRGEVLNEKQFYHRTHDQIHKGHHGSRWKKRKLNDCFAKGLHPMKMMITEKEKNEINNKCDKKDICEATESSDPLSTILNVDLANPDDVNEDNKSTSPTSKSHLLPSSLKALQTIYNSDEDDVNEVNGNENLEPSTKPPYNSTILKELKSSSNHQQRSEHQMKLEEVQKLAQRPWHSKVFKRDRPTLLEKLLAKEIRHERNVILQCIWYIVKNNFFDKPTSLFPDQ